MGWYLRKSLRFGPLRINLSKSGIGGSVGVTGLRVGTGPKGPYLQGGREGLYFRQSLGRKGAAREDQPECPPAPTSNRQLQPLDEEPAATRADQPGRNQFGVRLIKGMLGLLRRR